MCIKNDNRVIAGNRPLLLLIEQIAKNSIFAVNKSGIQTNTTLVVNCFLIKQLLYNLERIFL